MVVVRYAEGDGHEVEEAEDRGGSKGSEESDGGGDVSVVCLFCHVEGGVIACELVLGEE